MNSAPVSLAIAAIAQLYEVTSSSPGRLNFPNPTFCLAYFGFSQAWALYCTPVRPHQNRQGVRQFLDSFDDNFPISLHKAVRGMTAARIVQSACVYCQVRPAADWDVARGTKSTFRGPREHLALQTRLTVALGGGQEYLLGRREVIMEILAETQAETQMPQQS